MSDRSALIERAANTEPVADEVRTLADALSAEEVAAALTDALDAHEVDAAMVFALVQLAQDTPPSAEVVERLFPDSISDRASQVLVASHPEALTILTALFQSRRLDRYQLATAAALYTHLAPDGPWPAPLLEILRTLARAREGWIGQGWAREAALRCGDAVLDELYVIDREREKPDPAIFELGDPPGIDSLPPTRSNVVASGFTARRASPKTGRNDPCPCGSGKKYKKCCAGKDRGTSWSPVAGISMREYRRRMHEFLTADELIQQHPADLTRLPLPALNTPQLDACFTVFVDCERLDDAERVLALLAERDLGELTPDDLRAELVAFAHDWGHDELVARHLPLFDDPSRVPPTVALGRALRAPDAGILQVLEAECRPYVMEGGVPPMELAYELLEPYPALGIIVARGCLDPEHALDSETLLGEVHWARDRLGAPADEPYQSVWDLMVDDRRLARASDAEKAELQAELTRMREEAKEARANAHVLVRELGLNEEALSALEEKATAAEARADELRSNEERSQDDADRAAAAALRDKIRQLQGRIREGHSERAELRRRAQSLADEAREHAAPTPTAPAPERGEPVSPHGIRVPMWSDKARGSLAKLPKNIVASAIATAGALGAGRPDVWRHAKRLEGMHGLCSARLGIHHRLLFTMENANELDVAEVVTREDLDRALAARR
ncbi:MAG: SEC-C metal-binding domain-containing protein [Sandaracinaceae bacterium]